MACHRAMYLWGVRTTTPPWPTLFQKNNGLCCSISSLIAPRKSRKTFKIKWQLTDSAEVKITTSSLKDSEINSRHTRKLRTLFSGTYGQPVSDLFVFVWILNSSSLHIFSFMQSRILQTRIVFFLCVRNVPTVPSVLQLEASRHKEIKILLLRIIEQWIVLRNLIHSICPTVCPLFVPSFWPMTGHMKEDAWLRVTLQRLVCYSNQVLRITAHFSSWRNKIQ